MISKRYTLFNYFTLGPSIVLEIFAKKYDKRYRILVLTSSTTINTVGKKGAIIEILEWKGPYYAHEIVYQLTIKEIIDEQTKLDITPET